MIFFFPSTWCYMHVVQFFAERGLDLSRFRVEFRTEGGADRLVCTQQGSEQHERTKDFYG